MIMKEVRRNHVGVAMLLLSGIATFFVSCEKDALGGMGELVEIHFTLGGTDYGDGGTVTRSAGRGLAEEMVVVPLDENYCLYATLKEDEASNLRASTLTAGTLLRIVAFKGGVDQGSALYKVASDGTHLAPEGSTIGLVLPEDTYTFVAYSYNSTTVAPDYSSPVTDIIVSPEYDLLWGDAKNVDITGGADVGITLYHKFSQVKVNMTTAAISGTPAITAITDFTVSPGYKATLTVADGEIEKEGTAVTQIHAPAWDDLNSATVTGATGRIVYTAGEQPVSVTIGSVTIGANTYTGSVADFDMPLVLGKSYTLEVRFKMNVVIAGSNIYWDTGRGCLTFDAPGASLNNQRKQGVFFKWGSLVGISPAGAKESVISSTTKVYAAKYDNNTDTWGWENPNTFSYADNSLIPWLDNYTISMQTGFVSSRFNTYLMDDERNDATYWGAKTGDICRYISENGYGPSDGNMYRMPTAFEYGAKNDWITGYAFPGWTFTGSFTETYSSNAEGTTVMDSYASHGSVTFPASGHRFPGLYHSGLYGEYWHGSIFQKGYGAGFLCVSSTEVSVNPQSYYNPYSMPVRCVKK
jgi:hypothetical protein